MIKIKIDDMVKIVLKSYTKINYEIGGIMFGNINEQYEIKALSFKNGQKLKIEFKLTDYQLFYPPESMITVGTWHYHPNSLDNRPSFVDKFQYRIWGSKYIHIIINNVGIKVYNYKGEMLHEEKI